MINFITLYLIQEIQHQQLRNYIPNRKYCMNSNSNNLCPFYRFPSDFGGPNYEQNKLKIENIRKKVGDMHKITNEKQNKATILIHHEKTKSQRQMLISTAEKQLLRGNNICQFPKIRKKSKKIKEDLQICRKSCLSITKLSSQGLNIPKKAMVQGSIYKNVCSQDLVQEIQGEQNNSVDLLIKPKSIYIFPFESRKTCKIPAKPQKLLILKNNEIDQYFKAPGQPTCQREDLSGQNDIKKIQRYEKESFLEELNQIRQSQVSKEEKKNFTHKERVVCQLVSKSDPFTKLKKEQKKQKMERKKFHSSFKENTNNFQKTKNKLILTKKKVNMFHNYCKLLEFVSISFGLSVKNIRWPINNLRVYVGEGNNKNMIINILKRRNWWIIVPNIEDAHFVWTQTRNFKFLKTLFEFKKTLLLNQNQENNFQISTQEKNILTKEEIKEFGKEETIRMSKVQFPKERTFSFSPLQELNFLKKRKIHNHFPGNLYLTHKKYLYKNIKEFYQNKGEDPFQIIPLTYHVKKVEDEEWQKFASTFENKNSLWIIKPGENTNRGIGIKVQKDLAEIQKIVQENQDCSKKPKTTIIQQYITPLLYYRRKFDFRCYLLVFQVGDRIRGYWYEDGYIRTASKQFNAFNIKDRYIHLTNDFVQKKCDTYGKYQIGNKLSLADLQNYLNSVHGKTNFNQILYKPMIQLTQKVLEATYEKLNPQKKQFCFEVFGLDFMLDENFKIWLIEVNANPCLETQTTLLYKIITSMIQNTFKIALDPFFRLSNEVIQNSKWLEKQPFKNNKYTVIFSKKLSQSADNQVNMQEEVESEQQI